MVRVMVRVKVSREFRVRVRVRPVKLFGVRGKI